MDHLSWQWRPHIAGCKLFLTMLRAELAVLTHFFAKCINCTCEEAKKTSMECFFFHFIPPYPPPKIGPKKLTRGCLQKVGIDPYSWQTPSYELITGLEDLALNAWTKYRDRSLLLTNPL